MAHSKSSSAAVLAGGFEIQSRTIGSSAKCFVIAEGGVNHNGNPELAHKLVDAAADAGVDAIKFQTFNSELLVQRGAESASYQRRAGSGPTQLEMLKALELPEAALLGLAKHARDRGLIFLSTPFDEPSVDFLALLGVPAFKIGSGDVTSYRLLRHVGSKGLPVLLSTGMSNLAEVQDAVALLRGGGVSQLGLFHCVSSYPASDSDANLRCVETLRAEFKVPCGYSDHHVTNDVAIAAVARGAEMLEKHLTLDKFLPGPDHAASLEPQEFAALMRSVRAVESAVGNGVKAPTANEQDCREKARRSLVSTRPISLGERIEVSMLTNKRPATGIPPKDEALVVGRVATVDIPADSVLSWQMLKES